VPYSAFKIEEVESKFQLNLTVASFLEHIVAVTPSNLLVETLAENLPLAKMTGSEKAKSELIISPILVELRRLMNREISLFSGESFSVDASQGLNGVCDFLISKSPVQIVIKAPAIIVIEAKQGDLKAGWGQCIAEMVAAQRFNLDRGQPIPHIYGSVTTGLSWQFFRLTEKTVSIEPDQHSLSPVEHILGVLKWMLEH
jgi:hypothetical protein